MLVLLTAVTLLCIFNTHPVDALKGGKSYPLKFIERVHHET